MNVARYNTCYCLLTNFRNFDNGYSSFTIQLIASLLGDETVKETEWKREKKEKTQKRANNNEDKNFEFHCVSFWSTVLYMIKSCKLKSLYFFGEWKDFFQGIYLWRENLMRKLKTKPCYSSSFTFFQIWFILFLETPKLYFKVTTDFLSLLQN